MKYKNILLIDDDEDDQEIFHAAVEKVSGSAKCISLSDATEALQKLVSREVTPDVIFLDLNMPIMNGQQFLTEIKKNETLKTIPVIIFSTSAHSETIQITKSLGASDFISKPAQFTELINILTSLIVK